MFVFWVVAGFVGTEFFSYVLHRYFFHGPLWFIHKTHHLPRRGWFEFNDVFSIFFSCVAIVLMVSADSILDSVAFPVGAGVTLYGLLYFVAHDAYTHKRLFGFDTNWSWLNHVRSAHRKHHRSIEKPGLEPFGLFWTKK